VTKKRQYSTAKVICLSLKSMITTSRNSG